MAMTQNIYFDCILKTTLNISFFKLGKSVDTCLVFFPPPIILIV